MPYSYTPPPKKKTSHWYDDLGGAVMQLGGAALGSLIPIPGVGGAVGAALGGMVGGAAASAVDPEYGTRSRGLVPIAATLGSYGIGKGVVAAGMNEAKTAAEGVAAGADKYRQGQLLAGRTPEQAAALTEQWGVNQLESQPTFTGGVTMGQYAGYTAAEINEALRKQLDYRRLLRDRHMAVEGYGG